MAITQDGTRNAASPSIDDGDARERILNSFRRWGYLQADIDPLGRFTPVPLAELDETGAAGSFPRRWYCGPIGAEFMHIPDPLQRRWIQEQLETEPPQFDGGRVLDRLIAAEVLEDVLHARYPGTKRFSLEGATALIPLLDELLTCAAIDGATEVMLGVSHRGRLNVMVHTVGKDAGDIFAGFEDTDPRSVLGGGDVKYHQGASGTYQTRDGHSLGVQLVSNPSHLEAVYPVVLGRARARQVRLGDEDRLQILPVVLHGDGAFAGQGIVAETLNLAGLAGYAVGGTIHVIVNNLIGFTTDPAELHSSRFATDVAKRLPIPILHVNGENLPAVVRAGRFAAQYRRRFKSDVIVDLIGFRRYGHSEVDDPTVTHPSLYARIKEHPPLWRRFATELGVDAEPRVDAARTRLRAAQESAVARTDRPRLSQPAEYWHRYRGGCYRSEYDVDTGVSIDRLRTLGGSVTQVPTDFGSHPKIARLLHQRAEMVNARRPTDFGMAETLAFATLLDEGVPVRLTGQDSVRGTFSHRHAVFHDANTGNRLIPLQEFPQARAAFEIHNSPLSENAAVGFEFGYNVQEPGRLVIWEAQYGDFVNGAQVMVDQFITSARAKWRLTPSMVFLLPHGYEGQGPEHSSARPERFLEAAADINLRLVNCTTAAQYFHLLRRQAALLERDPLPLFVLTPKSLLRHPSVASTPQQLADGRFMSVLDDEDARRRPKIIERVVLCSGKVYVDLISDEKRATANSIAICRVEQLYPFPEIALKEILDRYASAREIVWLQEEPENMGAWPFYRVALEDLLDNRRRLHYIGRGRSSSPSEGSAAWHHVNQKALVAQALDPRSHSTEPSMVLSKQV